MEEMNKRWKLHVYCPNCKAMVDAPVLSKFVEAVQGSDVMFEELFVRCPVCSGYPHSPLLFSDNEKNRKAALAQAEINTETNKEKEPG